LEFGTWNFEDKVYKVYSTFPNALLNINH